MHLRRLRVRSPQRAVFKPPGTSQRGTSSMRRVVRRSCGPVLLCALALASGLISAQAQDATWIGSASSDWNTGPNWSPATVPTGIALFGVSGQTLLTFSQTDTSVNTINFLAGASAYNLTIGCALGGPPPINDCFNPAAPVPQTVTLAGGIVNNAASTQTFTIINSGTLVIQNGTAANTTLTNNGGTLQFGLGLGLGDTGSAGTATINNNSFGTVQFNDSTTAANATVANTFGFVFFNDSSSAGSSTITNAGSITFAGSSTAANANIINSAGGFLLTFADTSTAGSATITTNAGSKVQFSGASNGGTARFITNAGGTFDISGLLSGGTTAGSIEGAGTYALGGNTLTVGGNNLSTTVSGTIADGGSSGGVGGSLVKEGTGTLTLSGTNTYTGTTIVNSGTLQVDGSTATSSLTTVDSGGTLTGAGTVGNTQINSGGLFRPGTPATPGTSMAVSGTLALPAGSIYNVFLDPATSTLANATGAAALGGTALATFAAGTYTNKPYDILHAGSVTSAFGTVQTQNLPSGFTANLSYTATDVFLNLSATLGAPGGLPSNQQNVAHTLNTFFNNGGTLPANFATIFGLTGGNLSNALSSIDGEAATGAERAAFQLMNEFLLLMLDPFVADRGIDPFADPGAPAYAAEKSRDFPPDVAMAYARAMKASSASPFGRQWSVWAAAYGGSSTAKGEASVGSNDVSARTFGGAAGLDYRYAPDGVIGFSLGGGGTNWGLAQALGGGRSDAFQAGVYGVQGFGAAYLGAAFGFANHWVNTDRTAFAGDRLSASFNAQSYGGRLEGGYRIAVTHEIGIAPYAAVQAQRVRLPAYAETDLSGGGFALSYASRAASDTRSELGARFDSTAFLRSIPVRLRGRLAWGHDWASDPSVTAAFQSLTATSFTVSGAPFPKDSALASFGGEVRLTPRLALLAKFDGEFASRAQTYAGSGTLRYVW